jgi:hypothetical protein
LPLPESQEGCKLGIDITGAEQDAQRSIRAFQTGRAEHMIGAGCPDSVRIA